VQVIQKFLAGPKTKGKAFPIGWELLEQIKGDQELYEQLIRIVTARIPELLGEIETTIDREPSRVVALAHTLKGTSAMFRLHGIKKISQELELAGKEGDENRMRIHLQQIKAEFHTVRAFLEDSITDI